MVSTSAKAPRVVTEEMVKTMEKGSVLVDISIDQGGCFETSRPTTHQDPVYAVDGIMHYCVANMPGAVPQTSTRALGNATLPFVLALAGKGWRQALRDDVRAGFTFGGIVFEEYRGQATDGNGATRRFIAAGEAHAFPVGTIGYRSGAILASGDTFTVKVSGKQTHGGFPWNGIDPIVSTAQTVVNCTAWRRCTGQVDRMPVVVVAV